MAYRYVFELSQYLNRETWKYRPRMPMRRLSLKSVLYPYYCSKMSIFNFFLLEKCLKNQHIASDLPKFEYLLCLSLVSKCDKIGNGKV